MKKVLSVMMFLLMVVTAQQALAGLVVIETNNANTLTNSILGSGITVVGSPTYSGGTVAAGTFTGGLSAGIGIQSGIILTSGKAGGAVGPNNSDAYTLDFNGAGDAQLTALIPGYQTHDATSLSFTFSSAGGDLFFNYAFGSEEYNEWVGSSFNDVFGFFLDGENIALIPGTTTAVAINNVNLINNSGSYNNNDPSNLGIPTPFDIQYDGFTDVFQAKKLGLSAGEHTIKLAIADAGDWILDSGVFIQAGSFSDKPTPTTVPEPGTMMLLGSGLVGLAAYGRKRFRK